MRTIFKCVYFMLALQICQSIKLWCFESIPKTILVLIHDNSLCHHHHRSIAMRQKLLRFTWLLFSIYLSDVGVTSMSRSLCLSASGFTWWYPWTGDEGALSFCDQKTVESREPVLVACLVTTSWGVLSTGDYLWSIDLHYMAALSVRVFPCLSCSPSMLSSWLKAYVAHCKHAAFSPVVCKDLGPYRRVNSTIARYILPLTCVDTWSLFQSLWRSRPKDALTLAILLCISSSMHPLVDVVLPR